ncbi:MBL fold metallo-hydrolase [Mycolicibacterium brisbanense]|uniref:Metallo-beta-lactamase domain-containing protein n=1 Tax=Mycolicibacterium brisbanense TaxID=146020 RepID=A0A100W1C0_9MYCO|nr:MBL fold metallo-hydrolase [Mycolicibacterium brisbanense]MCV7160008.1 MBL fold metallo-hydrolase [Mycolicibacterium brisbanense]GAS89812.1 uncharacterized protein RMCB_3908 [Mycolicibacterium brisbanense]
MKIRRLGWAGIEVGAQGASLVVDYVRQSKIISSALPPGALLDPQQSAAAALVTHLHADHTDVPAIQSAVGPTGIVLRPPPFIGSAEESVWTAEQEARLAASTLDVRTVSDWQRVELGPFTVTAVPSVDGLGDPQVNWVIEADGQRIFHGGDTIFHGYWWLIARRVGPIDVAVLPINGAAVNFPHLQPASPLPAVLTPEQAAQAAAILHAKALVPMHFGVDQPPFYVEQDDAVQRLGAATEHLPVRVVALAAGEAVDVTADLAA